MVSKHFLPGNLMTYCVAVSTDKGLVFCSDSRTNAGPDMLSSYSKMHMFNPADDRVFVILASGNLATTQSIINRIEVDIEDPESSLGLKHADSMNTAAHYIAQLCREENELAKTNTVNSNVETSVTFIFGGQIRGSDSSLYLVYSAGNFITESDVTPFLQIGESKYGKPILDRIITRKTSLDDAARCCIVSMDSTLKSNATVGPPIELLVYENDRFKLDRYLKMEEDDDYLREIRQSWNEALNTVFAKLPRLKWEKPKVVDIHKISDKPE